MPKHWSIPRTTHDALGKLSIQRSPAIAKAIWEAKEDPARIVRAMQERLTHALATATAKASKEATAEATAKASKEATAEATAKDSKEATAEIAAEAASEVEERASVLHERTVPGSKLINGDEYVRVSVSYPAKTAQAVEYLAGLFKLSYEETVRLSLEAYIKHL